MDNNDKIPQFNLGAGTYNSTVFLRGDGVWADPLAAGFVPTSRTLTINGVTYDLSANRTWTIDTTSATWGNITGVLSSQTDLQSALNAKQNNITLTTTGTSGAATLIGATLNIPRYDSSLIGYVPYTGATGNVNLGEYGLSAGWLRIDTSPTTYVAGTGGISWNSIDGTADLELLNGVTLQIGQELHFYAKATEAIPNGSAVMFAGVQGDHLLIAKANSSVLNSNPNYFMGVATQDFINNEFGYVTAFGSVRGLNTTAYSLGSILYFDSTSLTPGLLTATMPNANLAKIEVAAVVRVHANQGILMVRPHIMPMLNEIQDVNINLSKTKPIDTDSVLLQDTADSNIWKKLSWLNTKATLKTYFDTLYQAIGSYVPTSRTITINGNSQDLSANRTYNVGTVTSVNVIDGPRITSTGGPVTSSGEITISHGIGQGLDVQQAQDLMNRVIIDGGSFEALRCLSTTLGELGDLSTPLGTSNSGSSVIQNIMLDEFGHIIGLGSKEVNPSIYDNGISVGIGTTNPHPSAILDLKSTTQGFLPPRMDNSEINAISNPAEGLIVYSTQSKCLFLFDGANWQKIAYV
jgi:hypothetical protein